MSWHLAIHGHFKLPKGKEGDDWARASLDPAAMKSFAEAWPDWFQAKFKATTVGALLGEMEHFGATSGHEFLDVKLAKGKVSVRGLLSEGSIPAWVEPLVAALQAAAELGATGELLLVGLAEPIAARLTLAGKRATWEALSEETARRLGAERVTEEITALSEARSAAAAPAPAPSSSQAEPEWHLVVFAEGMLASGATAEDWAKQPVDPSAMADLARTSPGWFKANFEPTTVGALLAEIQRYDESSGGEFVEVKAVGRRVDILGLLGERSGAAWTERLTAAVKAAAGAGAYLTLFLGGPSYPASGRLLVRSNDVTWETLDEAAEVSAGASFLLDSALARSKARGGPPRRLRRRAAQEAAAAGVTRAKTGTLEVLTAVADAVAAHPKDAVLAAARRASVLLEIDSTLVPLEEVFPTGAALVAACRPGSKELARRKVSDGVYGKLGSTPAFAVSVLAALDPAAAEPLALRLFGERGEGMNRTSLAVWLSAARALGRLSTPASIAGLVAGMGVDDPYLAPSGLAHGNAAAGSALLAWLAPRLAKAGGVDLTVTYSLDALGALRYEPAALELTRAWRDPAVTPFRGAIGAALLAIGNEPGLRALEERLDDDDDDAACVAMTALLRRDADAAEALLLPEFERKRGPEQGAANLERMRHGGKRPLDRAFRALGALAGAPLAHSLYRPREIPWRPNLEARWIDLGIRALDDEHLAWAAWSYLAATRDHRAAVALAKHVGTLDLEQILHSLEYIGDASVVPTLESYAATIPAKKKKRIARLKTTIDRLSLGERPPSVTTQLWAGPDA